jgi:hypothetical protein
VSFVCCSVYHGDDEVDGREVDDHVVDVDGDADMTSIRPKRALRVGRKDQCHIFSSRR